MSLLTFRVVLNAAGEKVFLCNDGRELEDLILDAADAELGDLASCPAACLPPDED